MKKHIFILSLISVLFASCEKVVNIDLNNASPMYVIEGQVFEGTDTVSVRVLKTTDYYGKAPQQQIDNAVVTIADSVGNTTSIPLAGNGKYLLPGFTGVAGMKYQLKVVVGTEQFTAVSTMPYPVNIDSVSMEFKSADFRDEGYEVAARFTDPAGQKNFYRLIHSSNDTLQNEPHDLYLMNDKFNDGRPVKADLNRRFKSGDKIGFELRTMDEQVFDFFITLNDALNNQDGPAPANPNTNIKGGALGYFGAFTSSKKTITIP